MILYLYSLKNRLSGLYERPVAEVYDSEQYLEHLSESLACADVPALNFYKEFDVYKLGKLDTKSGKITPSDVVFVGTLEALCLSYLSAKDKKNEQDGRSEEHA